jgi:hypothetical protein
VNNLQGPLVSLSKSVIEAQGFVIAWNSIMTLFNKVDDQVKYKCVE